MRLAEIAGWGRFPRVPCRLHQAGSDAEIAARITEGPAIARGMGRSYGDSALNPGATIDMRGRNRMLAFDDQTGQLAAEAGVVLGDIITAFLPRGWFPAVTPGTRFVTLGGMIAADVHGKNHHRDGSMSAFVDWIDLLGPDGEIRRCSRTDHPDLFNNTLGGMGLTGIILRAALRLRRVETAWIRQETIVCADLGAAMSAFEAADASTYSVAWIDCLASGAGLGRSLLMLGEHALPSDLAGSARARPFEIPRRRRLGVPFNAPGWALNRFSVRAFNALYYRKGTRNAGTALVDWESYFYPLDAISHWNRIYGRRGFAQFQCVIPAEQAGAGLRTLLEAIAESGQGSFLAVLKRLGPQESAVSFPMDGYTLALDFPVNRSVLELLDRLDAITLDHGGRFYLAKDSRMTRTTLLRSDPRMAAFTTLREASGARDAFHSLQSARLGL